jgi:hypothetical protein
MWTDYRRDFYAGLLMMLLGVGVAVKGTDYRVGSLTGMGPGFFPVALGVILALLGVAIAGSAHRLRARAPADDGAAAEKYRPEWRGWIAIVSSIIAFVVLGRYGGLLPAAFAITFISALGDRDNSWRAALILALAISAVSVIVFWWALRLQFPLFSWG